MALMEKAQIEKQYGTYEEIAKAFSYPGRECTEIYLCTHISKSEPSHYEMVRRPDEKEALFDSSYIEKAELAWSRELGVLIPYK